MSIKVLMIDVDGVVITHPHPDGWSANLQKDLGFERETLQAALFKPHFADIVHGRASFQDRLGLVSGEIVPHLTCDQHIDYGFANDANLDVHLLEQFAKARSCGLTLRPATAQDHK